MLPRDFSEFDSIFCCKAVPGVGGTVLAGVLRQLEDRLQKKKDNVFVVQVLRKCSAFSLILLWQPKSA